MLKVQYQKLRLSSKGNLKRIICNGVPVLSIFALVGIFVFGISFAGLLSCNNVYAAPELGDHDKCTSSEIYDLTTDSCIDPNNPVCPSGYTWDSANKQCKAAPSEPTTPSTDATPSVSMTIDNNTIKDTIYTGRNTTAYASHTISISASNIEDYKLTLSPTKTLTGPSTIGNASGQKGSSMIADTWGYGWGATSTADSDLSYNALASSVNLAGDSVSNNKVDFSRKLAFAAKFSDNATEGTYSASVNLALTVTPQKIVAWNDMVYMQDMSAAACESVPVGTAKTLTDIRDSKSYTVTKLNDGNCWMTSNLAFDITQATNAMSSTNSDVASGWSWPTTPARYTTGTGWSASDTAVAYITTPTVDSSYTGDGSGLQSNYGYYYSWCAATAGCKDASGNNPGANVDAASSICPKGWKLPAGTPGTGTNDFAKAIGLSTTNIIADTNYWSSLSSPALSNRLLTVNSSTWTTAGVVDPGNGLRNPGTGGYYWSRTANSTTGAYHFSFDSGLAYPARNGNRRYGYSVRCVAYSS